jgi:hypothetical protein
MSAVCIIAMLVRRNLSAIGAEPVLLPLRAQVEKPALVSLL